MFIVAFLVMVFSPAVVLVTGMKLGKIDFDVSDQKARTFFYLIIEGFYVAGTIIFSSLVMPSWIFFNIGIVSMILNGFLLLINFKWKISAHAAGAAGPTTGFALIFGWWTLIITGPCVIAIIWSRFYLKKHTMDQLLAGTALAILVYSMVFIIVYPLFLF